MLPMPPPPPEDTVEDGSVEPNEAVSDASSATEQPKKSKKPWSKPTILDEAAFDRIAGGPQSEINEFASYYPGS